MAEPPDDVNEDDAGLEREDFGGPVSNVPQVQGPSLTYDPARNRETVRAAAAIGLVALLGLLSCAALGAVIAGVSVDAIRSITEIVLSPVVALCGSALGFYYAGRGAGS